MSSKTEPTLWSRDTSQQKTCFDRSQLTVSSMSNIEDDRSEPELHVSVSLSWSIAAILHHSAAGAVVVVVVVVRTRRRTIPLAMITMRKSISFLYDVNMVPRLGAIRAAGSSRGYFTDL